MLTHRQTERLTGLLLILGVVLFLGHVVTLLTLGPGRNTIVWVYAYGFLIGMAGAALHSTLHGYDATLSAMGAFGLMAHGILVVVTGAFLLAGLEIPGEYSTFGGELGVVELTMDSIRSSSFVFLGLGLIPLGVLLIRAGMVARWIGWLGLLAGIGTASAMFLLATGLWPRVAGTGQIAALTVFGFQLILGIRLQLRPLDGGLGGARPASRA